MKSFVLTVAICVIAVAGTSPAVRAEAFEAEAQLTCPDGEVKVSTITCQSGEVVVAEALCADGTTMMAEAFCPEQASGDVSIGRYFRMGLRLHLGGFAGVPRTDNAGDNAGANILGSLVLSFPTLLAEWWGLEFSAGSGVALFPQKDDVLSANVFATDFVFDLGQFNILAGYRFTSLADLDESLGHGHHGHLGVAYELSDRLSLGIDLYLGQSAFVRKERFSQSNEAGTITYVETTHPTRLSGGVELTATFWFW